MESGGAVFGRAKFLFRVSAITVQEKSLTKEVRLFSRAGSIKYIYLPADETAGHIFRSA